MRSTTVKAAASPELVRLQKLTAALKSNLEICAEDPTVDAVHDARTGTRRIEAMLDSLMRERVVKRPEAVSEQAAAFQEAAQGWLKLLKKIRRAAGAVRDLDVHRNLLEKQWLAKRSGQAEGSSKDSGRDPASGEDQARVSAVSTGQGSIEEQAGDLDTWLKHVREHHVQPLIKSAAKWSARLDDELVSLEAAMARVRRRGASRSAAVMALEEFARLCQQMERLDGANLHDFAKGRRRRDTWPSRGAMTGRRRW